jgi:hypothetical protein
LGERLYAEWEARIQRHRLRQVRSEGMGTMAALGEGGQGEEDGELAEDGDRKRSCWKRLWRSGGGRAEDREEDFRGESNGEAAGKLLR